MTIDQEQRLQAAVAAFRSGQKGYAQQLLEGILLACPDSERAWFWLSQVVEAVEERRFCLERVLALNRRNALARRELEALGPGPSWSPLGKVTCLEKEVRSFWFLALGYLVVLAAGETLIALVAPRAGLIIHSLLLMGTLVYSARYWNGPFYRFWVGMSLPPLIRLVSLSLPLRPVPLVYWYLIVSIPLFAAAFVMGRFLLQLSWDQMGLHGRGLPHQIAVSVLGVPLGILERWILRPTPLLSDWNAGEFLLAALILMISTGLLEELIFRGVLQYVAVGVMGKWGIVYTSLAFAILHIGYRSVSDVLFVFGVALLFGWYVQRTRSIVGVSLAHGIINVWLFLIAPFL